MSRISQTHCHLFVIRFPPVASSPACSLSRPSASSTSLERTRLYHCTSAHWSGLSGCLTNLTPNTGFEPDFCTYINDEHTPINLPDSNRNLPCRDDATTVSTTEDPEGFQRSGASSSSKHTAASRVPTVLGSFGTGPPWQQMAFQEIYQEFESQRFQLHQASR